MSALTATQELKFLDSSNLDPTVPRAGQLWQAKDEERGGGMVCLIDRVVGGEIAYFTPGRDHYILVENLRLCWRCVDHLPRALFLLDGRLVRSWREMAIAAQVMVTTSMSSV